MGATTARVSRIGASGRTVLTIVLAALVLAGGGDHDAERPAAGDLDGRIARSITAPRDAGAGLAAVGQSVELGRGGRLVVHAVHPDVPGELSTHGAASAHPNAGNRLVAIDAEGCAGPQDVGVTLDPDAFELEGTLQLTLDGGREPMNGEPDARQPALTPSLLSHGQCARGWVTFEAPRTTSPSSVAYGGSGKSRWTVPASGRRVAWPAPFSEVERVLLA